MLYKWDCGELNRNGNGNENEEESLQHDKN